jgi:glutathione S-transferase
MKLHYSPASPYVRKVMVCAIARGIGGLLEKVSTNPHQSPADLLADNPLSKVPALVTKDGTAIYDSPVICEYLDTIGSAAPLFPPTGSAPRLKAMIRQAAADGILDAAVARRLQMGQPQDDGRKAFVARQKAAVERAVQLGAIELGLESMRSSSYEKHAVLALRPGGRLVYVLSSICMYTCVMKTNPNT